MNPDEQFSRKRVLFRWSLFLLTVLLAVCTLTVLIRSGKEGWDLKIRKPVSIGKATSISTEVWVVHIGWSYLGLNSENAAIRYTRGPSGGLRATPTKVDWIQVEGTTPRLSILDWPLKVPLLVVLVAECLALFFLVPSVIGRVGRR